VISADNCASLRPSACGRFILGGFGPPNPSTATEYCFDEHGLLIGITTLIDVPYRRNTVGADCRASGAYGALCTDAE
jgi:hypothetical protein